MPGETARKPDAPFEKASVDLAAFFDTTYKIFQEAEQRNGSVKRFYSICGHSVELRFAGSALIPSITPALGHLLLDAVDTPSLTVCIWDDISTNTHMPPPPWSGLTVLGMDGHFKGVYTRRGDVRGFSDDRILTSYNWDANALSIMDKKRDLALYWTYNAARLPSYESSAPLRTIFNWWINQFGFHFVHSGAVGTTEGGVLLAGKGGVGKSTTALSCLNSDLLYVSDDYCLICGDPAPYAFCIYSSAKLNADDIQSVPHVFPTMSNIDRIDKEKAVFFLHPIFAKKIVSGFPIRAILLPLISAGKETSLSPASSAEALKALALSTMSQLPGAGRESLQIMTRIVHRVPCYHIELGGDLTRIPHVIGGLLRNQ
jgi:hypothetical protein